MYLYMILFHSSKCSDKIFSVVFISGLENLSSACIAWSTYLKSKIEYFKKPFFSNLKSWIVPSLQISFYSWSYIKKMKIVALLSPIFVNLILANAVYKWTFYGDGLWSSSKLLGHGHEGKGFDPRQGRKSLWPENSSSVPEDAQ